MTTEIANVSNGSYRSFRGTRLCEIEVLFLYVKYIKKNLPYAHKKSDKELKDERVLVWKCLLSFCVIKTLARVQGLSYSMRV